MGLLEEGKLEQGLAKLKRAAELDPKRADYRQNYLTAKERYASEQVVEGERAAQRGQRPAAETAYKRALAIDPGNQRARQALAALENNEQEGLLMEQAQSALDRGDFDLAASSLRTALVNNPRNRRAKELLRQVERQRPRQDMDPALAEAYKKPISIAFRDVPLRAVFEVISRSSGLNIIYDRDFQADQRATISLKNSTIESVLNVLSTTHQIDYRTMDSNTIMVYANTSQKAKDYQPLIVKTFLLSSADAKQVANTIRTIAKSKDVVVDEKLNMLIVRDNLQGIRLAERLVALHDVREAEVMLEVEVLEISEQRLLDLGVKWPSRLGLSLQNTATPLNMLELTQGLSGARRDELLAGLKLIPDSNLEFAANFSNSTGDVNIIANPRIRVKSRDKAKIVVGDRVPVITVTGNATNSNFLSESVNYVDVGLKLEVEPTVYLDDEVSIRLSMEVSNIAQQITTRSGSIAYQIGTRNASTVLQLVDGETQVLAGLINDEDRKSASQLPGLGDVPLLGRLFGNKTTSATKTEIVLAITPRIVRNIPMIDSHLAEFDAGTETDLRTKPLVLPRTSQSVPGKAGAASANGSLPVTVASASQYSTNSAATGSDAGTSTGAGESAVTKFSWRGPNVTKTGEIVELQLHFDGTAQLVTLPMSFNFDPKVFELVKIEAGKEFSRVHLKAIADSSGTDIALKSVGPISKGGVKVKSEPPAPYRVRVQP
jgi:general secretion pathway protein D